MTTVCLLQLRYVQIFHHRRADSTLAIHRPSQYRSSELSSPQQSMGASALPTIFCRQVRRKRLPGLVLSLMPSHGYADRHKCIRAGDVLFLLAICFDKCSVILLTRRLLAASQHQKRLLCEITIGLCAVWWLCSTLAITIDCNSYGAIHLDTGVGCPGLV